MLFRSDWYQLSLERITQELDTDVSHGLTTPQIEKKREQYGANTLTEEKKRTIFDTAIEQFKSPLVFILLIAGVVTIFLHEYIDAIVIGIALLINLIVGVVQEERASNAFEKLSKSQQKYAVAIRNGHRIRVATEDLVPGDVVVLEAGMSVPADVRLIDAHELTVNESILTGEWIDVEKRAYVEKEDVPLTKQYNMLFMGTTVSGGVGHAVVVATGDRTELGGIAQGIAEAGGGATPLQKSIAKLATYLAYIILGAIVVIFALGFIRGEPLTEMFLISIAIAVAALPSGLPAAVTVVLAIGMETILKQKGLVRNLLAAETLGSTTIILTDKTGTITKARMGVSSIVTYTALMRRRDGKEKEDAGKPLDHDPDARDVLAMSIFTAGAFVEGYDNALSEWIVQGRPVERATVLAGLEVGLRRRALVERSPELDFVPFESEHRYAASLHALGSKRRMYISGAPELLLEAATHIFHNGKKQKLSEKMRKELSDVMKNDTSRGLRLIATGYRDVDFEEIPKALKDSPEELCAGLVFGGFIEIHDPIRDDAAQSIQKAQEAGAQVIMVTGDNEHTARRVAAEVGIIADGAHDRVLTGKEIEALGDKELLGLLLHQVRVVARVLPRQKMRIVEVLKKADEVVAMTGDGINDAPALRRADIGVALGSGTEVAKEASDVILLNNSFSIIVGAIEEGRRILDNLKKIVTYLLSTSFSEIFVVAAALFAATPLPLLPTQILWTKIVEEGFMNFSFAFEPKEDDIMKRSPREHSMKNIVTTRLKMLVLMLSTVVGGTLVGVYFFLLNMGLPIEEIRTVMFVLLSFESIFFAFSIKDLSRPLWHINPFSNRYLIFALGASTASLLLAIYFPPLQKLLSLVPLHAFDVLIIVAIGIFNVLVIETMKYLFFIRRHAA